MEQSQLRLHFGDFFKVKFSYWNWWRRYLFNCLYLGGNIVFLIREYFELILKSDGRIVSSENLGSQTRHEAAQVLVEDAGVEAVKEVVTTLFILHKELQVLEDALFHLDKVVVADRILAKEVELNDVLFA